MHFQRSDLRALARLVIQATEGVTRITEGVHQSVWSTLGVAGREPQRTGGLTGLVYRGVVGITRGAGWSLDRVLASLERLGEPVSNPTESAQRSALISVLNGVMGDRLVADQSPFAIPMSCRIDGVDLDLRQPAVPPERVRGKILLMIHGLCMNDRQWRGAAAAGAHDHGRAVADPLGYCAIHLRYNTGRHISHNGSELADRLEQLLRNWPVPVDEVSVLAHSMGGLVIRSAIEQATERALTWPARVKHVVFLGTPHHGAPLERAGHGIDRLLASSRWTAPFTRLAGLRSAGITDLRHGNLLDRDWLQPDAQHGGGGDTRVPLPLPPDIRFHAIAATTAARRSPLADRLSGDGLVPLNSALGRHREGRHRLRFADGSTWISYRTGHIALLRRAEVSERMLRWLAD